MYKRIIHFFVLSCEKATFLIEKQLHTSLSLIKWLQLRVHLSICKNCTAYKYKALFLDKLMADERTKEESSNRFSEEEVAGLKKKFKSAIRQNSKIRGFDANGSLCVIASACSCVFLSGF